MLRNFRVLYKNKLRQVESILKKYLVAHKIPVLRILKVSYENESRLVERCLSGFLYYGDQNHFIRIDQELSKLISKPLSNVNRQDVYQDKLETILC